MVRSLLLIIALVLFFIVLKRIRRQPPEQQRTTIKIYALYGLIGGIILLALTGKIHWIGAAIAAFIPFVQRLASLGFKLFPLYEQWRREHKQQPPATPSTSAMDYNEAMQVFGFETLESKSQIIKRHRELMQKNHPDRGGSDYLAARINEAKTVLINALNDS